MGPKLGPIVVWALSLFAAHRLLQLSSAGVPVGATSLLSGLAAGIGDHCHGMGGLLGPCGLLRHST